MEKTYRLKANVGKDQVINVNVKRDVDAYEVLSLKLTQEKLYKLHSSDYGVIVGRVLANDAFGIPNAKVSVFIPIKNEDRLRSDIKELYPYRSVSSYDSKNRRFNTLPNYKNEECHKPVGSFPSKREVLDEETVIEVYDKYYKYTTVTNNAGDYMIFGVPVGEQIVHVDIDLSDIGVLSQRPTDFIYKGYSLNLFESPAEFKKSTNLNELPQIISEDTSVNVYPFWGDKDENEIAITRKDVRIQYKFEPTCVFLGSVITDSSDNSISQNCVPNSNMGEANQLVAAEGTIEMIRKTVDDNIEEFNIKGNQLIDSNGVWCYQIPMNLDYVCTDEYGNIVPTDNPTKGIPTRARVRFRITLSETENESLSSHKARYLVPNNPELIGDEEEPYIDKEIFDSESYYQFGTLTKDECFRDLLWNKVYSVKSYIPRIQKSLEGRAEKNVEYLAIKGVNKRTAANINPIPFNKLNLNFSIPAFYVLSEIFNQVKNDPNNSIFAIFWNYLNGRQLLFNIDAVYEKVLEDMDAVGLDFYNDWLNGCLYFPNWYWYLATKKNIINGKRESKYESQFCDCSSQITDGTLLGVLNNCSLNYSDNELNVRHSTLNDTAETTKLIHGSAYFENGIIMKKLNKDGLSLYYYSFGQPRVNGKGQRYAIEEKNYLSMVRLFSTDIILLGSLTDCDIHGIPKVTANIPSTTANIPPIGTYKPDVVDGSYEDDSTQRSISTVNGMSWGRYWYDKKGNIKPAIIGNKYYSNTLSSGLFFGLSKRTRWRYLILPLAEEYIGANSDIKSCVNAERMCELGVTNDSEVDVRFKEDDETFFLRSKMDGLITRKELLDVDTRSLFATLNSNPLNVQIETDGTGYKTYNMYFFYPNNFDGRMEMLADEYTSGDTHDVRSKDYLDFRFGSITNNVAIYDNYSYGGRLGGARTRGGSFNGWRGDDEEHPDHMETDPTNSPRRVVRITDVGEKKRHFYGGSVIWSSSGEIEKIPYAFPIYDNSFYFYFGINSSHNAISEFYKNFMGYCLSNNADPFSVSIDTTPSSFCGADTGKIVINVNGAEKPYSITISSNVLSENIVYEDLIETRTTVTGLSNGSYVITVADASGRKIEKTVVLKQSKIKLDYYVSSDITSKKGKTEVCEDGDYGALAINSYTVDGEVHNIEILPTASYDEDNNLVLANDKYKITIGNGLDMHDYYCSQGGNEIYFGAPSSFALRIQDVNCPSNYYDYTFNINLAGEMDLYINTMPYKFFDETKFHTSSNSNVTDVKGWFGVHDPKTFKESFYGDATTDNNKEIWDIEGGKIGNGDVLLSKFKMLFNLSSAAYVVNMESDNKNVFKASSNGARTLIRSGYPDYDSFMDKEQRGTFSSFITCNNSETNICPNNSANIVSANYSFTDNDGRPQWHGDIDCSYSFNPKYSGASNSAGNYFAAFSNNANYVTKCEKSPSAKKCVSIPSGCDDLSSYGLCTGDDSKDVLLEKVYNNDGKHYLRTEFIDRRLDYDFIYVTPCNTTDKSSSDTIWKNGRLSGLTYNGVEMLYNDQYVIVSKNGNTEYNYDSDISTITLNKDAAKRLYKSEFDYGGSRVLDLRELYYSKRRKNVSLDTFNNDNIKIHNHSGDDALNGNCFDNFGLSDGNIVGYPTKRLLDIYNIPFGSGSYKWSSMSCTYDNSFDKYDGVKTSGSDEISYKIDVSRTVQIVKNDVTYSVKSSGDYLFGANRYDGVFKSYVPTIDGLTGILKMGKVIRDDSSHSNIKKMKETTNRSINEMFNDSSIFPRNCNKTYTGFTVTETNLTDTSFVGFCLYYIFENNRRDNLLKRIQLYDLSNYFNISDIKLEPYDNGNGWYEKIEVETTSKAEKFYFLITTNAFIYNDIDKFSMSVELGNKAYYDAEIEQLGSGIMASIVASSNNKSITQQNASMTAYITLKNGIKYVLPFKINSNGNLVN